MKPLTEKEAKKKACPYDGSKCGASTCMAWTELRANNKNDPKGYCARIHKK
jgi:hypothetical protein